MLGHIPRLVAVVVMYLVSYSMMRVLAVRRERVGVLGCHLGPYTSLADVCECCA
jgi:hypothetical protein